MTDEADVGPRGGPACLSACLCVCLRPERRGRSSLQDARPRSFRRRDGGRRVAGGKRLARSTPRVEGRVWGGRTSPVGTDGRRESGGRGRRGFAPDVWTHGLVGCVDTWGVWTRGGVWARGECGRVGYGNKWGCVDAWGYVDTWGCADAWGSVDAWGYVDEWVCVDAWGVWTSGGVWTRMGCEQVEVCGRAC